MALHVLNIKRVHFKFGGNVQICPAVLTTDFEHSDP